MKLQQHHTQCRGPQREFARAHAAHLLAKGAHTGAGSLSCAGTSCAKRSATGSCLSNVPRLSPPRRCSHDDSCPAQEEPCSGAWRALPSARRAPRQRPFARFLAALACMACRDCRWRVPGPCCTLTGLALAAAAGPEHRRRRGRARLLVALRHQQGAGWRRRAVGWLRAAGQPRLPAKHTPDCSRMLPLMLPKQQSDD